MKRIKSLAILLLLIMLISLFGCQNKESDKKRETEVETYDPSTESTSESTSESTEESLKETEAAEEGEQTQKFEYKFKDKDRRGINSIEVGLVADTEYELSAYEDQWSDKVPGIVGVSVMIFLLPAEGASAFDSEQQISIPENVTITFDYDENELMGVPEENLIVLCCEDDTFDCSEVEDAVVDVESNKVTAEINDIFGIYMLADAYQWYQSQGKDASEYAYEVPDEISNLSEWEKEFDTGSIVDLVDHDYIEESGYIFHVSTPEKLASAVYYVNTVNSEFPVYAEIYLDSDIDLTGYDWMPIGWVSKDNSHACNFVGVIDGQGHTIKGLKINGRQSCGFIGYSTSVELKNISFVDADITGSWCVGICAGQIIGNGLWENVHASGNLNIKGNANEGGLAGWITDLRFEDCSADFTINGGDEVMHYLTYKEKRTDEIGIQETFNLTLNDDNSITRDDHPGFRNLTWHVEFNGETILGRDAEDNMTLFESGYMFRNDNSGTYTIFLEAYVDDIYIRVSNIIEFTI